MLLIGDEISAAPSEDKELTVFNGQPFGNEVCDHVFCLALVNVRIPRKMGTDSTRSWALIPRHRGQPFQTSGRLADRFMESGLSRWVKRF